MGLFNKRDKSSDFSKDVQPISGGNKFENEMKMEAQDQIDRSTLDLMMKQMGIANSLQPSIISKLDSQTLDTYWLLELQINYFVNTIQYDLEDRELFSLIKSMMRIAIKNGHAGLYKQGDTFSIVGVNNITYSLGKMKSVNVSFVDPNNISFQSKSEYDRFATKEIFDLENLALFKWGSAGLSAWITLWKLCVIQNELLTMINVDKYSYIKKFTHIVNDPSASFREVDDYFDIHKPYIRRLKGVDLTNRLEINENHNVIQPNILVEYYKQVMGIYYAMFGRRTNNDFKKERSVTQEIGLTSDNYLTLEKDWTDEFKYFAYQMKKNFSIEINVEDNKNYLEVHSGEVQEMDGEDNE